MPSAHPRVSPQLLAGLGFAGAAACGPLGPQSNVDTTTGSTSDDPSAGPSPSGPTTDEPTTDQPTSDPPPQCIDDSDCNDACSYCYNGVCEYSGGCCYDGIEEMDEPPHWRCSPPYECYTDEQCGAGYVCTDNSCRPSLPVQLPLCPSPVLVVSQWNLSNAPGAFVLADLDGDSDLDLAAAEPSVAQIEIALNDGFGNFEVAGSFGVGGSTAGLALAAGDLDGDLDNDLVVVRDELPGGLFLAFGQDAMFVPTELPVSDGPNQVFVVDADTDGRPDIVTVSSTQIAVRRGDGGGGFAEPIVTAGSDGITGKAVVSVSVTAVRLLAPVLNGPHVVVWGAQPSGEFSLIHVLDTTASFPSLVEADLAFTGLPDLIAVHTIGDGGFARVYRAAGIDAWNATPNDFAGGSPLIGAAVAEFDEPPGPDVVSATGTDRVAVLLGDGAGGLLCEQTYPAPFDTSQARLAVGDLDGNGCTDLVIGGDAGRTSERPATAGAPRRRPAGCRCR